MTSWATGESAACLVGVHPGKGWTGKPFMHYHPHPNGHHGLAPLRTLHDYPLSARPPAQAMEFSSRSPLHGQSPVPIGGVYLGLADGSMGPVSAEQWTRPSAAARALQLQSCRGSSLWWARDWRCLQQSGPQTHRGTTWPTVQRMFKRGGFPMLIVCWDSMLTQVCTE